MNDYRPDTPRAAFAFGAVGLMALTLGAFVVAPAVLDSGFAPETTLAATTSAPVEVAITPATIEVVGVREQDMRANAGKSASLVPREPGVMRGSGRPVPASVAWAMPHSEPCKPQG